MSDERDTRLEGVERAAPHGGPRPAADGPSSLWPVFLTTASVNVSVTAVIPLIPLLATARGASPVLVGVVVASTAALPLLMGVWAGVASDVLGTRRTVQVGALAYAACTVGVAIAPTVPLIIVWAALWGLAQGVVYIACQTAVAQAGTAHHHDRNYGTYTFWASVGGMLGPLAGGLIAERWSIPAAFYVTAAFGLTPLLFAARMPGTESSSAGHTPAWLLRTPEVYRAAWALTSRGEVRFILWIVFLSLFAWDIKLSFLPLYLQSVGLPTSEIGLIFSCMSGGSMVIRPLLGTLTGRFGRRPILLGAVGLGAIGIGLVPFLREFWPLALAATAAGVASGITQPLTMSLIAGNVQPGERGLAMSLRMSTNRLADLLSPIVFGALVTWTGLAGAFGVAAATLLAGVAVVGRGGGRAVFGQRE